MFVVVKDKRDLERISDLLNKVERLDIVINSDSVANAIETLRDVLLKNHYTTIYVWVRNSF